MANFQNSTKLSLSVPQIVFEVKLLNEVTSSQESIACNPLPVIMNLSQIILCHCALNARNVSGVWTHILLMIGPILLRIEEVCQIWNTILCLLDICVILRLLRNYLIGLYRV